MSDTYRVYPGVTIGEGARIGDYVTVGVPPEGSDEGELETTIGEGATIRSHAVIYAGSQIGRGFHAGHHAMVREHCQIGDDVSVGTSSVVEHHVAIGNRVRIHSGAFVPEFTVLEDDAWVGPNVVFTNALHPECPKVYDCLKGAHVRQGAKIGANVTILPGVEIGREALIGAGSVVVKDVPPRTVVVGNPARVIESVDDLTCPFGLIATPYARPRRDEEE